MYDIVKDKKLYINYIFMIQHNVFEKILSKAPAGPNGNGCLYAM
jgi:hypothetical protein